MSTKYELLTEQELLHDWQQEGTSPVVSVVCITFNHVKFIAIALESILAQRTNFPFEIIVRDDASTDGTQRIIEEYQQRYPKIIKAILEKENTYSKGIRSFAELAGVAKSNYIAICDGDDYWGDPTKLQKQVDYLESNPDCVMTFHESDVVDQDGQIIQSSVVANEKKYYSKYELLLSGIIPNLTRCYRNYADEYPEELGRVNNGDMFMASFLSQKGYAQFIEDIKPSYYRKHDGGVWTGISSKQKRLDVANTFYWLAVYYGRIGKPACAERLANASIQNILSGTDLGRPHKIRLFFRGLLKHLLGK